ncbi:aromatic compound dioxygenase [Westerdykella ornata]|uniref:Aromatic compound dioxygenase n=1 Tax=Westerdykella ornata TaxID=318751 RepID=A0A6A6JGK4_WESOR|nr:aromatic compound dioxygenase [Westerdykella ornata]KAF2275780.1 aromatic compound dioxygenase [Westerdykella ornata]
MAISTLSKFTLVLLTLLSAFVFAHPRFSTEEIAQYRDLVARHTEALGRCLESPHLRELNTRMLDGYATTAVKLRKARGLDEKSGTIDRRDKGALKMWIGSPDEHKTQSPDPQDLCHFRWDEPWKEGQPERQNITAEQAGVYMRLALQVIDIATCNPVPGARVDVWHANALGEYGPEPTSFLRGCQRSSVRGTVDFDTIFPSHYPGRSTHVHVLVRPENQKKVAHVGMLYFPDDLREAIEATPEYAKNLNPVVRNADDAFAPYSASYQYDPFVQWSWLGSRPADGVLTWIAMGVNLSATVEQPPKKRRRSLFDAHLAHDGRD